MPVEKYEEGASKGAPHPLLYFDGLTDGENYKGIMPGIPVLKQRDSTLKGFNKIWENDRTPMNQLLDFEKANKNVMKNNRGRWWNNAKRNNKNYPDMSKNQSLKKYKGILSGEACILIGAGPSLKKNGHLLKDTDITKIAMMHALPYLDKIGVIPDFVVHSDALSDDKLFVTESSKNITLIANSFVAPALLRKWEGDIAFYYNMAINSYGERINRLTTADTEVRPMGCSMAAAMSLASELMDANTIIFVGNDLAYSEDFDETGNTHIWDGLPYNNNEVAGIPPLIAEGAVPGEKNKKKKIKTCYSFIQYRHTLMEYCQIHSLQPPYRRYINATEGGILILPETLTLKEALKSVENTTHNINAA